MNVRNIAVDLIALHGGKVVGRTQLQKLAYLLQGCGADFNLRFVYRSYGPYSLDLADELTETQAKEWIDTEEKLGRHGVPYAIFTLKEGFDPPPLIGDLDADKARRFLSEIKGVSDIVLELAATIVFLRDEGGYPDSAVEETRIRKPLKATDERMAKAHRLLDALGLSDKAAPA